MRFFHILGKAYVVKANMVVNDNILTQFLGKEGNLVFGMITFLSVQKTATRAKFGKETGPNNNRLNVRHCNFVRPYSCRALF